ncbi:succinyl-diaminopimelate desuccinylase [Bacillus pakistanensis]|uniref:Succinyl-diaminopimelate desuccinylase n=1 Tax=Rossellomorea pakistanensis TaxID=992288 RepID=A0ABS2NAZ4_9BACI|nr:dipeptidase PepV [Bacillus pakistanensis]MBM7585037.1 succinyl-diaminopimelate desuccinylase [Bacillus pakistanensis]
MTINWMEEVEKRKEDLLSDLQAFLQIKSVLDEENTSERAPLGEGVRQALDYLLELGKKDGFQPKDVDGYAGHLEFGKGEDLIGILCHVDVVPEGDGWSVDPFGGEIKDGKIYARGAIDDKGPTIAAYYAMKIVKELGLPLEKRVRMIIGTDEESDWRCVEHYFKNEEMPTMGFAPDADFPIIYAEKGIADFDLVSTKKIMNEQSPVAKVVGFQSGRRYNMVPDFAKGELSVREGHTKLIQLFEEFIKKQKLEGRYYVANGIVIFELEGVSSHGMEPNNGKNAGLYLSKFLTSICIDDQAKSYFSLVVDYFFADSRGNSLGVAYKDDITGELTINVGKLSYDHENGGMLGLNMRYPVTFELKGAMEKVTSLVEEKGFQVQNFSDSSPHHVSADNPLVKTLQKVYEEQTGEEAGLISIGGGTYARSLSSGVAFGALFPGREDIAHQKDEYMYIEDLLKATAIYAQAIFELAKRK